MKNHYVTTRVLQTLLLMRHLGRKKKEEMFVYFYLKLTDTATE